MSIPTICLAVRGEIMLFSIQCITVRSQHSLCYCFTKLLRPLVRRWRSMSHAALVFLDDGISGHGTKVDASAASLIQQQDLLSAGFTPNAAKCDWEPCQLGEWLGMLMNTIRMCFQISPRKIAKSKSIISHMLSSNHVKIRDTAKIAGFINSLYLAVSPATRLFTRQMHFAIMQRNSWDSTISINEVLRKELRFWYNSIDLLQGYHMSRRLLPMPQCIRIPMAQVTVVTPYL